MNEKIEERMFELLADHAIFGLTKEELAELRELEQKAPHLANDFSFERAAAALQISNLSASDPVPAKLISRLEEDAAHFFSKHEERDELASNVVNVAYETPKTGFMQWLGWALAGAACVALGINIWFSGIGSQKEIAREQVPPPPPTVSQKLESLLATGGPNVIRSKWISPQKQEDLSGEVVWSDSKQEGYMTFRNLPVNDTAKETYQLWIFDENQPEATPVDGGVFDVSKDGEAVIPINAKIQVKGPKAFAVTVEKPGGVVVSKREKIVALAQIAS